MIIGTFTKKNQGYSGKLVTLTHSQAITIQPAEKGPDFHVLIGEIEVGAAWNRTVKKTGKPYLSVKLDSPFLPAPLNCALMEPKEGDFILVWNRDERKPDAE